MWHDANWMWPMMLLFWGLISWAAYALLRRPQEPTSATTLALLDRRYAQGELTTEEYDERRATLRASSADPTTDN